MKTGTASYKKNEKKQNNIFNKISSLQNDPLLMQQQYLNQFYLSNGYINPYYYQLAQLMNQNYQNLMNYNFGINQEQNRNEGSTSGSLSPEQYQQGQDINQLFNHLSLLNHDNGAAQNKGNQ